MCFLGEQLGRDGSSKRRAKQFSLKSKKMALKIQSRNSYILKLFRNVSKISEEKIKIGEWLSVRTELGVEGVGKQYYFASFPLIKKT